MRIKEVGYIVERLADRFRDLGGQMAGQEAAHKAALTEIRASFVARAGADEKLIEGYRRQIVSLGAANDRLNDLLRVERLAHQDKVATDYCEPCDQPKATPVMPKPGDMVRLVSRPERDNVDKNLRTALRWPWEDRWGVVGQTRKVVAGCRYIPGAVAVATDIYAHWPLSCVEVVAEATHDTEAGKATAESVIRDSRNAEIEMCVGDEVEVIGLGTLRALLTGTIAPIGTRGIATMIHSTAGFVELDNGTRASIKDVRKVTT